jgi:hypothetical protein
MAQDTVKIVAGQFGLPQANACLQGWNACQMDGRPPNNDL